jgi:hypothetical protein
MELEKCACCNLLIWKFQEDGYAFTVTPEEIGIIKQLPATTSQKLLGVIKNPIGNQQDEIHQLKEKSN